MSARAEKIHKREDGSTVRVECTLDLPWGGKPVYAMQVWVREKRKRIERHAHGAATDEERLEVALMAWESIKPTLERLKP